MINAIILELIYHIAESDTVTDTGTGTGTGSGTSTGTGTGTGTGARTGTGTSTVTQQLTQEEIEQINIEKVRQKKLASEAKQAKYYVFVEFCTSFPMNNAADLATLGPRLTKLTEDTGTVNVNATVSEPITWPASQKVLKFYVMYEYIILLL